MGIKIRSYALKKDTIVFLFIFMRECIIFLCIIFFILAATVVFIHNLESSKETYLETQNLRGAANGGTVVPNYSFVFSYNPLVNATNITADELYPILYRYIDENNRSHTDYFLHDKTYITIGVEQFKQLINTSIFCKDSSVKDFSDCDDYAFKVYGLLNFPNLSGLAVGVLIWDHPPHAEPFFIDNTSSIWVVDNNSLISLADVERSGLRIVLI